MKLLTTVIAILLSSIVFSQYSVLSDLKIVALSLRTQRPVSDVHVKIIDRNGELVFEGCTDSIGEITLNKFYLAANADFTVHFSHDKFRTDFMGMIIHTDETTVERNVMKLYLLNPQCWYFPCYAPVSGHREEEFKAVVEDVRMIKTTMLEEYGETYAVHEIAITIEFSTLKEEKAMRAEAVLLLKHLEKEFPELKVHKQIITDYLPDHEHKACLRVTRMK